MTREEMMIRMASVLTTALETEPDLFPESMAYMAFGWDLPEWQMVKHVLLNMGLCTFDGNVIALTPDGRAMARQFNDKLNAAQAARK